MRMIGMGAQGAEWIQLDEPILALDLDADWQAAFVGAYRKLRVATPTAKLLLTTYFGELRDHVGLATGLSIDALHIDVTRAERELDAVTAQLPGSVILSLGVVDGRNIWKNDFDQSLRLIERRRRWVPRVFGLLRLAPCCTARFPFDGRRRWTPN